MVQLDSHIQRNLIHGYYACVAYIDAQIGKIKTNLKDKDSRKNSYRHLGRPRLAPRRSRSLVQTYQLRTSNTGTTYHIDSRRFSASHFNAH